MIEFEVGLCHHDCKNEIFANVAIMTNHDISALLKNRSEVTHWWIYFWGAHYVMDIDGQFSEA